MTRVSHVIDRVEVSFDDPNLVANAGLLLTATVADRLGLEALIDAAVKLGGRVGGARPGRKVLTLSHAMIAWGDAHRSRRHVARRLDGCGVGASGDGPVDVGDVPQIVHVRARPPVGSGQRPGS